MTVAIGKSRSRRRSSLHPSYAKLLREWPLRAIKSESDYETAGKVLDRLVVQRHLDPGQRDYLGALELLIEAYDNEHFPDILDERPPHMRLKQLMQSSDTSPAQLQRILGASQTLVSLMLHGKRELSKRTISKLAEHFRIDPGYFL